MMMQKTLLYIILLGLVVSLMPDPANARIPYRQPFSLSIYEIRMGSGFFAATPYVLLDSTETDAGSINLPMSRIPFVLSVDLLKYNYLNLLWKQNVLDYQIGLNLFYQRNAIAVFVPENWPQIGGSSRQSTRYRPTVFGGSIMHSFYYQPTDRTFFQFDYGVGIGKLWLYTDYIGNRYVDSDLHMIQLFGGGFHWANVDMVGSKFDFGISYRYHWLPFPKLNDPDDIAPISAINVSNHSILFTIGLILGGGKTVGDEARKLMKKGEYIDAESKFRKFMQDYPNHFRVPRAQRQLQRLEGLIPYQYFRRAEELFDEGKVREALNNYELAQDVDDQALLDTIEVRKAQISQILLDEGIATHQSGELEAAKSLYESARSISSAVEDSVARRMIRLHFDRAEKFVEHAMWEAALRELSVADSLGRLPENTEREYDLRTRIANGYLQDASRAAAEGANIAAADFIRRALDINDELRDKADDALKILHAQNWYTVKQRLHENITGQLAEGNVGREARQRDLLDLYQAEVGMYQDMVREVYGPPGEIYEETDMMGRRYQLWVYRLTNNIYEYIYFQERKVTKVEKVKL